MWNLEGTITGSNEAFLRMVQHSREDLATGRVRWADLTPPEWRGRAEQAVAELKATGVFQPFEKEYFRKDGSRVPVLLGGALFEGNGNEGVAFVLDLSEQKRVEKALRRSEAFLAEGQRLGQIGSYSWRVATDEITWSEQLYRIYELQIGVPVTLDLIRTRVHPEDVTLYEKMVEQVRSGAGSKDFEWHYRLLMPDHSIKYLHAVARATRDQNGQLEYVAAIQDVTARRLSEEARDKARSELAHMARVMSLGILTASMAHEINQPLAGIVTNADTCLRMLAADPPNVEGARETVRRTIRDGKRVTDVITRLRGLYSKKDPSLESMDLNGVAREVIASVLSQLQRNQVILRQELADDLPLVAGDRVQLQQVILNLIGNASESMSAINDRPRELLIRTERDEDDRVRLTVKDVGVGFAPHAADRLFESFYTTKTGGMGIGLSVSRSIIDAHQGRLWAALNDGPGCTFSFAIPCRAECLAGAEIPANRTDRSADAA
jgi:PAS domain S-box-containing protein